MYAAKARQAPWAFLRYAGPMVKEMVRSPGPRVVVFAVAALVAFASSIAGCFGATEIRVELTTTASCDKGLETQLFLGAPGTTDFGAATSADTRECGPNDPRIGTLSIVPSGARDAHFDLQIVAGVGVDPSACRPGHLDGCIIARRRVSFQEHTSRRLPVLLSDRCIGILCSADESCDLGICSKLGECTDLGCPRERGDVTVDAGPTDAAPDALPPDATVSDAADASVKCGPVAEVVVAGQNIRGQLALQGTELLYVNGRGTGAELRRVTRTNGASPRSVAKPNLVSVAATDTQLAYAAVTPTSSGVGGSSGSLVLGFQKVTDAVAAEMGWGSEVSEAVGLAGPGGTIVGITVNPLASGVTAGFHGFSYTSGGTRLLGDILLAGSVPEIGVDDEGEWYGVAGGTTVVHFQAASKDLIDSLGNRGPSADIAVANRTLYVGLANSASGPGIYAIPRALITSNYNGSALVALAQPSTMAAFGSDLYYIDGATLSRIDTMATGVKPAVLATVGPTATALVVDTDCVYWVEEGMRIMRRSRH